MGDDESGVVEWVLVVVGVVLLLLVALCWWWKSTAAYDDAVHARRKRFVTATSAQPYEGQHPSGSYRMLAVSTDVHGSLQKVLQAHVEQKAEEQYKEKVARRHRALSAMIRSGAGGSTFFDPSNIPETVSEDAAADGGEEEPLIQSEAASDDVETPKQKVVEPERELVAPLPPGLPLLEPEKCPKEHALEVKGTVSAAPDHHEGEMGERLRKHKAQTGKVTVSLMW